MTHDTRPSIRPTPLPSRPQYACCRYLPVAVLALLLALFVAAPVRAQTCYGTLGSNQYLDLNTQADVDAFNCTEVVGSLRISGSGITDLSNLAGLTSVSKFLVITNTSVSTLGGLGDLTSIGRVLGITNNPSLSSLAALSGALSVGGISLYNNDALPTLEGLEGVSSVAEGVIIQSNDVLTSLAGLNNLSTVGQTLDISGNASLIALNALANLVSTGGLNVIGNASLTILEGLDQVTSVGGQLFIMDNPSLTTLNSLGNVVSVGRQLFITDNNALASLQGLNSLSTVGQDLIISGNPGLTSLFGLGNLSSIGGQILITNNASSTSPKLAGLGPVSTGEQISLRSNEALVSRDGTNLSTVQDLDVSGSASLSTLAALGSVAGDLTVTNNDKLTTLEGLQSIGSVAGSVIIQGNVALVNLDGLNNLSTVGQTLAISNNVSLSSLAALEGLSTVGGELSITGNDVLSECASGLSGLIADDQSAFSVPVTISDNAGDCSTPEVVLEAAVNPPPAIEEITAPIDPVQVGTDTDVRASFTDASTDDTHTASWDWGDGQNSIGTVTEENGSGTVAGSHTYAAAGVYTVTLTVTDDEGSVGQSVFQYIVVYDPGAGFVTGGGWIDSPAGAYAADPTLTGKASFGFVAKYKKGRTVPDGNTQFQFKAGGLAFHSTTYEWLVVAGANAKFKGEGLIEGATGVYGFMLTAVDGQINGGGGVDGFRIKVWDTATDAIVYDNQMDMNDDEHDATALGGGSIVIHSGGKKTNSNQAASQEDAGVIGDGASAQAEERPLEYALQPSYPNPFNPSTQIAFSLPEAQRVRLAVYDVTGREVARLVDGSIGAGRHEVRFEAGHLPSGVYLYRIEAGPLVEVRRMVLLK